MNSHDAALIGGLALTLGALGVFALTNMAYALSRIACSLAQITLQIALLMTDESDQ